MMSDNFGILFPPAPPNQIWSDFFPLQIKNKKYKGFQKSQNFIPKERKMTDVIILFEYKIK